jgi:RarD protein
MQPILLVLMGILAFKEEMRKIQWVAFIVATIGVIILTIDYGRPPWISFALAFSWSSYSFVKKKINLGSLQGLAIETLISSVFYGSYLIWLGERGEGQFGNGVGLTALLIGAGVVTAVPLASIQWCYYPNSLYDDWAFAILNSNDSIHACGVLATRTYARCKMDWFRLYLDSVNNAWL